MQYLIMASSYVIKVHDLVGSFARVLASQREKLWQELFLDHLQWQDDTSKNVDEHQYCCNSHISWSHS
jgi:hypothetical protein